VARKRPTASEDQDALAAQRRTGGEVLTRAEVRALSRSAPLTKAEFKAHRRLADQRVEPLRTVIDRRDPDAHSPGP
jgi:hypothetical protein